MAALPVDLLTDHQECLPASLTTDYDSRALASAPIEVSIWSSVITSGGQNVIVDGRDRAMTPEASIEANTVASLTPVGS